MNEEVKTRNKENMDSNKNILVRVMKIDQFIQFFKFLKDFTVKSFSVEGLKKLYVKAKELTNFFSDTKNILILSRFTYKDTMSFSEIQREMIFSSSLLSYNLRKMTELGFLKKVYQEERENKKFSYYTLTDLGRKLISQIFIL